ncbi:MAG: SMP-30/gluconolactonase/LRE family protein [Candidatus Solibacter usitatus]|nr:SMP-30/gluconolactonase/LRE family protein [Candidatus Solibacter usitatus]
MDERKVMRIPALLVVTGALLRAQAVPGPVIETFAGWDPEGVKAVKVGLASPLGVAVDGAGNVYFSQPVRQRVHRVTPDGILQIVAGSGDPGGAGDGALATKATLLNPAALAVDRAGNLFIATNTGIRIVETETGTIRTVMQVGAGAPLKSLDGLAAGAPGFLIASDPVDRRIKQIDIVTGNVTVVAGNGKAGLTGDNGPALSATLTRPSHLTADQQGNIYYAELLEPKVRRIDGTTGMITTVPIGRPDEDFPGELETSSGLAADAEGNLYVAQANRSRVLKVAAGTGEVTVFAGTGSQEFEADGQPASKTAVAAPLGLAADAAGNLYIAELLWARIMRVDAATREISTIAGNGLTAYNGDGASALEAQLYEPANVMAATSGDVFVSSALADRVLRIDATGRVTTAAGGGRYAKVGTKGGLPPAEVALTRPQALWLDVNGDLLLSDYDNRIVRRVPAGGGNVVNDALAPVETATFSTWLQQAGSMAGDGTRLYLSSPNHHAVWVIQAAEEGGWQVRPYAGTGEAGFGGDGGRALEAQLKGPSGLALDVDGNLYIADSRNHRVRKVDVNTREISTVWTGDDSSLPTGLAFNGEGVLYVADAGLHRVSILDVGAGKLKVVVGKGTAGFSGDGGPAVDAQLNRPCGIGFDREGRLYIADTGNQRIRRISTPSPQ